MKKRISFLFKKIKILFTPKSKKIKFLYEQAYKYYYTTGKYAVQGLNFLPFLTDQHKKDWAILKAESFIAYCKKHNIVNERYTMVLAHTK